MAGQVLSFLADDLTKPFLHFRVVDVVVVAPAFIAGIVGRIDTVSYTHLGVELSETTGNVREQWNGEYYGSFGGGRDWECARKYGYFAAGGGMWYSRTLALLEPGSRLWVNNPAHGYVGVGTVMESRVKADEFMVQTAHGMVPITCLLYTSRCV